MKQIRALGAELVAVSPETSEHNRAFIKAKGLTFDLLSDPGNRIAREFGLVYTVPEDLRRVYLQFGIDVPKHNGDDSWTLPIPARFIIDQGGTIRYVAADPDYTVRPEPEHTLEALQKIQ